MKKEAKKAKDRVIRRIGKANQSYSLVNEDDIILVALSGGIDSFVLLDALSSRLKYLPVKYTLHAIHVEIEDIQVEKNVDAIQAFCNKLAVPLHIEQTRIEKNVEKEKFQCFPCSWNRRKRIFQKAERLGCNKVAFGHHMDDSLETLMMNMVHHAEISSIPPKVDMVKSNLQLIRPLILLTAEEIKQYAQTHNIQSMEKDCPFEDDSQRKRFGEILDTIGSMHDLAKINMFNSMNKIISDHLPPEKK